MFQNYPAGGAWETRFLRRLCLGATISGRGKNYHPVIQSDINYLIYRFCSIYRYLYICSVETEKQYYRELAAGWGWVEN